MDTVRYVFSDGSKRDIEISHEFKEVYDEIEHQEELSERRNLRKCDSFEQLKAAGFQFPDNSLNAYSLLEIKERNNKLYNAIFKLSKRDQYIIIMLFFYDTSSIQLSKSLGVSRRRINQKKHQILKKIKEFL